MQETLTALAKTVAPWWLPWNWRRKSALQMLARFSGPELSELMHQAARLYWHPGRRVDLLVWQILDEACQERGK